jgi:predicted NBD/HSP70 family sugar kinase
MTEQDTDCVIGLHIGASSRHAAIVHRSGKVLFRDYLFDSFEERSSREYTYHLEDASKAIRALVIEAESQGLSRRAIIGAGAVVPGSVDPRRGYVRKPPNLRGLQDTPLARDLQEAVKDKLHLEIPFYVENDGNGAALAEAHFGAGRDEKDFVAVMLCTGLGGGLYLDGRLYRGHTYMAGEIGHTTVQPNGPLCSCGGRGCLETLASGRALLKSVRESASPLAGRDSLRYSDLIQAAEENDLEVIGIYRTMGLYLGIGMANVVNTVNPSKVILTGHLARAAKFLLPSAREQLRMRVFSAMDCELTLSNLIDDWEVLAGLGTYLYNVQSHDNKHTGNSG